MSLFDDTSYQWSKGEKNWHTKYNNALTALKNYLGDKLSNTSLASWLTNVETDKNTVKTEVTNARGSKPTLTARLDVEHNGDGTHTASASTPVDWKASGHTPVYIGASSFKVAGQDVTGTYVAGRRLKVTLGSGDVYCTVASAAFATDTTIALAETNLDNTVSAVAYGIVTSGASGSGPKHDHTGDAQGGILADLVRATMDIYNLLSIYAADYGKNILLMIDGWADTFTDGATQNNTAIDLTNSTGQTYDGTNKLFKNTPAQIGATANVDFAAEAQCLQQEWTNANQGTSQATATNGSAAVTISGGTWPANAVKARISLDGGTTWYDIVSRDSDTQLTLAANFTGTTGAYNWIIRMSEFSSGTVQLNAAVFTDQQSVVAGSSWEIGNIANNTKLAQTFTAGSSGDVASVVLRLFKSGSPTDNVQVAIYATSGGAPTGSALSSVETLDASTLTESAADYTFTFSSRATLAAGTVYAIVADRSGSLDGTNHAKWAFNNANPYAGGAFYRHSGSAWGNSGGLDVYDFYFKVNLVGNVLSEYVSVSPTYAARVDTSAWSDLNSLARTETLNSQNAWYWLIDNPAASYGAGTTVKIWNTAGGVWRNIARNNGGTWEYNNDATATASETWLSSTVNDMLHAVSKAVSAQANNRMTGAQMAGVADGNLSAPNASQVIGVTLQSSSASQNPSVDNIAINYDSYAAQLSLVSRPFGGANMPPAPASAPANLYVHVIDKQISGTPVYEVSRDGGTTWTAAAWDKVNVLSDGATAQRYAQVDVSGQPSGTSPLCRVRQTGLGQSLEIHDLGLQYK